MYTYFSFFVFFDFVCAFSVGLSSQDALVGYTGRARVCTPVRTSVVSFVQFRHPSDATQFKETDCGRLGLLPTDRHFQCNLIGLFGGNF